jgi:hypothetical protein
VCKLVILGLMIVAIILMVEPEKLLYLSYFTAILVIVLVFVCTGFAIVHLARDGIIQSNITWWSYKNTSISSGYVISSMEVINYILNGTKRSSI